MKSEKETGNLLKPGLVRRMLASHSEMGLVLAVLIYIVCVTGTLVTVLPELIRWEKPTVEHIDISNAALARGIDTAVQQAGNVPIATVHVAIPDAYHPRTEIDVTTKAGNKSWLIASDGSVVTHPGNVQPASFATVFMPNFSAYVRNLHVNLTVPGYYGFGVGGVIGGLLVGLSGIALLALLITGILAHPQIFRDAFHLRWGGSKRLQEVDLHNRLGVWGLPFGLGIAVTGIYMAFFLSVLVPLAAILFGGDMERANTTSRAEIPKDARLQPRSPDYVSAMIAGLDYTRRQPDVGSVSKIYVTDPGTPKQAINVLTSIKTSTVVVEVFGFDDKGKFIKRQGFTDGEVGTQVLGTMTGLHFGAFGGLFTRLLYLLLGAGLCLSTTSGVGIWLIRNRDQRTPRPGWERIWCTTVWGVLIALSVSAIVALVVSTSLVPVFWGTFAALFVLPARMRNVDRLSKILRGLLAACLVSIVLVHIGVNGAAAFAITPLAINISLLVLAGMLTGSMFNYLPLQRRPARVAG